MGIVAYYARLSADQVQVLKHEPERLWSIRDDAGFPGAELTDLDRDWEILSWLLSAKKREEQKHQKVELAVMRRRDAREIMKDNAAWAEAMKEEQTRLGIELSEPDDLPSDTLLIAIEGRGEEEHRIQETDFGLKPTIRISHLTIREGRDDTVVASKMLYASHYFWTALELRVLIPDSARGSGFWFVTVSRSRSDGLSGFTGLFVRRRAQNEASDGTLLRVRSATGAHAFDLPADGTVSVGWSGADARAFAA